MTLENSLQDAERSLATLCQERDDAMSSKASKEKQLEDIRNDLRKAKNVDKVSVQNWFDLTMRVHDRYPEFSVWSIENWKLGNLRKLQALLQDT